MSYENARATKFLATKCAACGRPLVDSTSIEASMGPTCRKRYYDDAIPVGPDTGKLREAMTRLSTEVKDRVEEAVEEDDSRKAANILINFIAFHQKSENSFPAIRSIKALGYLKLASRIEDRLKPDIEITIENSRLVVATPYNVDFVPAIKEISGRRFDWDTKTWNFPLDKKSAVWQALVDHFKGEMAQGPKGPFLI